MPSPMYNVTFLSQSIQYTGSNSADLDSQVPNVSIISESGGVLRLDHEGTTLVLNINDWLVFDISSYAVFSHTQYLAERDCIVICSDLADTEASVSDVADDLSDLTSSVATLSTAIVGAFVRSIGVAPIPTLIQNQSTTVAVQLQPAMPDSGYSAYATTFAGVSLASLSVDSVTVVDADTVNVALTNNGVATIAGASVMVHAID